MKMAVMPTVSLRLLVYLTPTGTLLCGPYIGVPIFNKIECELTIFFKYDLNPVAIDEYVVTLTFEGHNFCWHIPVCIWYEFHDDICIISQDIKC